MILAFSVSRKEYNMYKKGQLFPIGPDEKGKHYWHKVLQHIKEYLADISYLWSKRNQQN